MPWARTFVPAGRLAIVAVHDGSRLRAVLPLAAAEPGGSLAFVGTPLNDRNGILAAVPDVEPAWRAALAALAGGRWSSLTFRECPDIDRRACLRAAGSAATELPREPSPVVPLPATWTAYEQALRPSFRERWRRALRRIETRHRLGFELLTGGDVTEQALAAFHERRLAQWRGAGRASLLTRFERSREFPAFLTAAGTRLARLGHLALANLLVDDAPVASCLYFLWGDTALDYMGTYERRLARVSPGILCTLFALRRLIARGTRTYDFGRGDEAYKFDFLAVRRDLGGVRVAWS